MKKKSLSIFLSLILILSFVFSLPVSADELPARSAGKAQATSAGKALVTDPLGLIASEEVMKKINSYVSENESLNDVMKNGNGIVFLFEGAGKGGPDSYTLGVEDTRDQALAVIVKKYEVTYADDRATTIPSGDPIARVRDLGSRGVAGVATICDGIYKLRLCVHRGLYEAFNLTLNGSDVIPCIRWVEDAFRSCPVDDPANLWADTINLHSRKTVNTQASDGCQVVGTLAEFPEFMSCAKAETDSETNESTYCVVDRTMATGLDAIYGNSVSMLTGKKMTESDLKQSVGTDISSYPILKDGSRGDYVTYLQQLLGKKMKTTAPADGIFGDSTRAAVIKFQRANGIPVNGVVGALTWKTLLR